MVTLASPAGARSPPQLPDLPNVPNADVERFQMTIRGVQRGDFKFNWTPGNECWHGEGTLIEHWEYARGRAVVMEFTKLGRGVLLRRVGRPPGDAAFAAPGSVTREATGFFDMGSLPGCGGMHSLVSPDCGKTFKVQTDLRLFWLRGKLSLERSGEKFRKNPAEDCGEPGGALNFEGLTYPYPLFQRQRTKLPIRKIFGRSRAFKLDLKANSLLPLRDNTWGDSSEDLRGNTQLTFKRLRDR